MKALIRRWIIKIVREEIKKNGLEVGNYKVHVIDGAFTITKEQ